MHVQTVSTRPQPELALRCLLHDVDAVILHLGGLYNSISGKCNWFLSVSLHEPKYVSQGEGSSSYKS